MLLPNQIKEREKENPNQIDQRPVQSDHLDGREIGTGETDLRRTDQRENHQTHSDKNVQSVQTGHDEIQTVEHVDQGIREALSMPESSGKGPMVDLGGVFDALDYQEAAGK